jgi:hypothetical protein
MLPDVRADKERTEPTGLGHKIDGRTSGNFNKFIKDAVAGGQKEFVLFLSNIAILNKACAFLAGYVWRA